MSRRERERFRKPDGQASASRRQIGSEHGERSLEHHDSLGVDHGGEITQLARQAKCGVSELLVVAKSLRQFDGLTERRARGAAISSVQT